MAFEQPPPKQPPRPAKDRAKPGSDRSLPQKHGKGGRRPTPNFTPKAIERIALGFAAIAILIAGVAVCARHTTGVPDSGLVAPGEQKTAGTGKSLLAPHLRASMIDGQWQTHFLDYVGAFYAQDGQYQLMAMRKVLGQPRYYSRGTYTLKGSIMTLTPDPVGRMPTDPDPQVHYLPLAGRAFDIDVRFKDGNLLWFSGPKDPDFPTRDTAYPLIDFSGTNSVAWVKFTAPATSTPAPAGAK